MSDLAYMQLVSNIIARLVPDKLQRHDVLRHLQGTDDYMDAHGKFIYEEETGMDHTDSKAIIENKIQELIA